MVGSSEHVDWFDVFVVLVLVLVVIGVEERAAVDGRLAPDEEEEEENVAAVAF